MTFLSGNKAKKKKNGLFDIADFKISLTNAILFPEQRKIFDVFHPLLGFIRLTSLQCFWLFLFFFFSSLSIAKVNHMDVSFFFCFFFRCISAISPRNALPYPLFRGCQLKGKSVRFSSFVYF